MTIRSGEIGKIFRVNADFDMTANSDLTLIFTKPNLAVLSVDKAGGVSAPGIPATDPDTGEVFAANEYFEYTTKSGDIDQAGSWKVKGEYNDVTPKFFIGATATFSVLG